MVETDPIAVGQLVIDASRVLAQGPPADLPSPVPEFVGDILAGIRSFVGSAAATLGETVSGLTPGAGDAPGR